MNKHLMKIVLTKLHASIHNMDMLKDNSKKRITLLAPAKINLTLEVVGKRADGYHNLRSVMHSIGVYDRLVIERNDKDKICITCNESLPQINTAYLAAERFKAYTNCSGVNIRIDKHIPSEAGLGGASADAAGVLYGMQTLFGHIDEDVLYLLGKSVGADVPFCLFGGCALAEGIGEKLTRLQPYKLNLLLVKGNRGISTGKLFGVLDSGLYIQKSSRENFSERLIDAMKSGSDALPLYNDLIRPAMEFDPEIEEYMDRMLVLGASSALMTGSGSVVYGIFKTKELAEKAYEGFADCTYRTVCETVPHAIRLMHVD